MTGFIDWCGFLGTWLLVAGPLFQAALELQEEQLERDRLAAVSAEHAARFPKTSPWWWLIPPVYYVLSRRRTRLYRKAIMASLTPSEREGLVHFIDKATGWAFVAVGGLLLALKETWQLREYLGWPGWAFWLVAAVMLLLSTGNTAFRLGHSHQVLAG